MNKILKFAALAAAAFALISCNKDPQNDDQNPGGSTTGTEYTEDLKFTLEVAEVSADQAKIKVEHNGTTKDTWYGFVTTESNVQKAIKDVLEEGNVKLKKNTKTTITLIELEPETEYTFIAVGITAEGKTYGEPATVKFTTEGVAALEFTENPAWTVTYLGDYEENGEVFEHVVAVETTDSNPFFVTAWPIEYLDEYGIEGITAMEIESWKELIAQYPGASFADVVYNESIMTTVMIDEAYGTKWYAMAIGCDTNGNATGLYALSEVIDLEAGDDTELTPEYAAWLGEWTITGANGITQKVKFSKGTANKTYKMSGYEGPDTNGLNVIVDWVQEEGIWVIYNQELGTYDFGASGEGTIWFTGEGTKEEIYLSELPICLGGTFEDGSFGAIGYETELEFEDGSTMPYNVATMLYLVYLPEIGGQLSYITTTYETGYPTFPMTFTPAIKTNSTKEFKGGKKTLNPLAPKTFKTFGLCDMSVRTF